MKKARFTDEQIVRILQEADRDPIAAVAKRHGVGESSIYVWRKRFGDMGTDDVKRLRNLEQENSRLKKILAERDLEIEVMKEITDIKIEPTYALRMLTADVANLIYRASYTSTLKGGKPETLSVRSSSVYVRRDGKWWSVFYQETPIK